MSKPPRPIQNAALVALNGSNVSRVLLIKIDSYNYITLGTAERFFARSQR